MLKSKISGALALVAGLALGQGAHAADEAPSIDQVHEAYVRAKLAPGQVSRGEGNPRFLISNSPFWVELLGCKPDDRCTRLALLARVGAGRSHDAVLLNWRAVQAKQPISAQLLGKAAPGVDLPIVAFRTWPVSSSGVAESIQAFPKFIEHAQDTAALLQARRNPNNGHCPLPGSSTLLPIGATRGPAVASLVSAATKGSNDYLEIKVSSDPKLMEELVAYVLDPAFEAPHHSAEFRLDGKLLIHTFSVLSQSSGDSRGVSTSYLGNSGVALKQIFAGTTLTMVASRDGREFLTRDFPVAPMRAAYERAVAQKWLCSAP